MTKRLILATGLVAFTGVAHVTGGGADVYQPLLAVVPSDELRLYQGLLWHFVTAYFALGTLGLLWAFKDPPARRQTVVCIGSLSLAMGVLFFGYGVASLGTVWTAPQWTILFAIAALTLWPKRQAA